jgi:hypothetical protein
MNNTNGCTPDSNLNPAFRPTVTVTGSAVVKFAEVRTLADVALATHKFSKLVNAEPAASAVALSISTGELGNAVLNGPNVESEEFAEKIAAVVIGAFVIAANEGIRVDLIENAISRNLARDAQGAVNEAITDLLANRCLREAA